MESGIIAGLFAAIPSTILGLIVWRFQKKVDQRDKAKEKAAEEAKSKEREREAAQESLMLMLIECSNASIALGEATARAVQRIPDAHCNGDMHAALEYAAQVKHSQKDFLAKQGVSAIINEGGSL